jgi:hypothetical protein
MDVVGVLDRLDPQEGPAEEHRQDEEPDQELLLPDGGAMDGHRHRQAAADQDRGIDRAEREVHVQARVRETARVLPAVDRVREEEAAEKEDLRHEEDPHPERRGLLLLPHRVEVVLQSGDRSVRRGRDGHVSQRSRPPRASTCRGLPSRRAAFRSCPAAAARRSSTRGPSRPTGWRERSCRSAWTRRNRSSG